MRTTRSDRIISPSMQVIEGLILPRFDPFGITRTVRMHHPVHKNLHPKGLGVLSQLETLDEYSFIVLQLIRVQR
jgi:hypothetical protein